MRDDHDRVGWQPIATVEQRGRLEVVLSMWFHDAEPLPGTYRAERPDGSWLELRYPGLIGGRS